MRSFKLEFKLIFYQTFHVFEKASALCDITRCSLTRSREHDFQSKWKWDKLTDDRNVEVGTAQLRTEPLLTFPVFLFQQQLGRPAAGPVAVYPRRDRTTNPSPSTGRWTILSAARAVRRSDSGVPPFASRRAARLHVGPRVSSLLLGVVFLLLLFWLCVDELP